MRKILLVMFLMSVSPSAFAQSVPVGRPVSSRTTMYKADASLGYYIKDGQTHNVYIAKESGELRAQRLFIPLQDIHSEAIFTPEEVSEWGLYDGGYKHYVGVRMDTPSGEKWYFMEKLQVTGENTAILYLSKATMPDDTYYLYDGDSVRELATRHDPEPMWGYLSSLGDCMTSRPANFQYPDRLRPGMVRRYYDAFVHCNEKMFPQQRFGVMASVGIGRPNVFDERLGDIAGSSDIITFSQTRYKFYPAFSVGVFYRLPFEEVLSFQPELQYFYHRSTGVEGYSDIAATVAPYIAFETHTVRIPLMFRFTNNYAKRNLMPYAELGPVIALNAGKYWEMSHSDRKRTLSVFTPGVAIGAGMEYYFDTRQAVSVGARLNWVGKIGGSRERAYTHLNIELVAGFSFLNF